MHSAISLIVSLLGVAGLYLLQQAEFLFAVQIVLYVGGIMVLFLFVIMLVNLDQAAKERQFNRQWLVALVGGGRGGRADWLLPLSKGSDAFQHRASPAAAVPAALGNTEDARRRAVPRVPAAVRDRFHPAAGGGGGLGGDGEEEDLTMHPDYDGALSGA